MKSYIRYYVYYYEVVNGTKYPIWVQDCVSMKDAKDLAKILTRSTGKNHYATTSNKL